jgi:hypothetical protein
MGGYSLPSFSTLGSQVHHSACSIFAMTDGTCFPHPHHVFFSESSQLRELERSGERGERQVEQVACLHILQWKSFEQVLSGWDSVSKVVEGF